MKDAMVGRYEYVLLVDERSVATAAIVTQLHGTLESGGDGGWSVSVVDRSAAGDRWAEITAAIEGLSHTSALWVGPEEDRRSIAERWRTSTADTVVVLDASDLSGDDRATIGANIHARLAPLARRRRLWPVRDSAISRRRALVLMAGGVG